MATMNVMTATLAEICAKQPMAAITKIDATNFGTGPEMKELHARLTAMARAHGLWDRWYSTTGAIGYTVHVKNVAGELTLTGPADHLKPGGYGMPRAEQSEAQRVKQAELACRHLVVFNISGAYGLSRLVIEMDLKLASTAVGYSVVAATGDAATGDASSGAEVEKVVVCDAHDVLSRTVCRDCCVYLETDAEYRPARHDYLIRRESVVGGAGQVDAKLEALGRKICRAGRQIAVIKFGTVCLGYVAQTWQPIQVDFLAGADLALWGALMNCPGRFIEKTCRDLILVLFAEATLIVSDDLESSSVKRGRDKLAAGFSRAERPSLYVIVGGMAACIVGAF